MAKDSGAILSILQKVLFLHGKKLDLVWIVNDLNEDIPEPIRKVKRNTFKSIYEWATAKVWVDNVRNYKGVNKKRKQFYIMTWHGSVGIKKIEGETEETLNEKYVKEAKYDGKIMNLISVNNEKFYNVVKNYFWYEGEILKAGIPRNSILQETPDNLISYVYSYFKIPTNKKIALYCPTFRDNGDLSVFKFNYEQLLDNLNNRFDSEFVLLIKLHPNVDISKLDFIKYNDKVLNANNYGDTHELLACASVVISDYSSLMYDAAMFNKYVFAYASDLDTYFESRGFIFSIEEIPFVFARNEKELMKNIINFNEKAYFDRCKSFFDKIGLIEHDNSLEVITKRILDEMGVK